MSTIKIFKDARWFSLLAIPLLTLFPQHSLGESLITYCTQETAPAATPEEKKWREAFSLEVMDRICRKEPEVAKPWRNSKYLETSWVHGINLTGVDSGVPRGTAITPRHVIYTKHYGFHGQVGQTLWFLTMDNRWVSRKIIAVKYLDNADVAIARLESDLPGSITPLKVLDPTAFGLVPNLVPVLRIEQQNKALIVDKRGWGYFAPGQNPTTLLTNPPERAFEQYYQNMVRFDSSSPSILLLRNEYGVMPILMGLVTFAGAGDGPLVHQLLPEIQATIASFGDEHLLSRAMPPITPVAAPSCSISAVRSSDGESCDLTVVGSADPVTGNPAVTPVAPSAWTQEKNTWRSKVNCSAEASTVFQATLTGPGGTGRTCESGALGPVLPQCSVSVSRRGSSSVCDVSVTRLVGNPTQNPVLSPSNPSDWVRSGDTWTGTLSCAVNSAADFTAQLTDEVGVGPHCRTTLDIYSEIPTCELTAKRIGFSEQCEITVTRKSGVVSGNPSLNNTSSAAWSRSGDQYTSTQPCSTESNSTFTATLTGPLGTGPVCKAPTVLSVPAAIPFCEIQAVRQGLTNVCKLTVNQTRGYSFWGTPVATPRNPVDWKRIGNTFNYEGTIGCGYNVSTQFSAYLPAPENIAGRVCTAAPVGKIPAPSCSLNVSRIGTTATCQYSLSATSVPGTLASFNFDGSTNRTAWNGSQPATGQLPCSQVGPTVVTASVWGPGGAPQSSSCQARVPRLPQPACQVTAQRRGKTGVCNINIITSGVIDTSMKPGLSPKGNGRWTGSNWTGTAICSMVKPTTFSATVFGPGGSQGVCQSSTVPRPR